MIIIIIKNEPDHFFSEIKLTINQTYLGYASNIVSSTS